MGCVRRSANRNAREASCRAIVNLCGDALDCGEVYRHERPDRTVGGHLLTLAADATVALTATLDEPAGGVYTRSPALVRVVEKLMRDEAYLAAIYARFHDDLETACGREMVNLRQRLLPTDQAERLQAIVADEGPARARCMMHDAW